MPEHSDLSALIGARICHDLIGPLGAIGNGVELLMMPGMPASPELTLVFESVCLAAARTRFFRVAYGPASADQRMEEAEIASILSDLSEGGRVQILWNIAGTLPRREVKLAFLLIQCLESALPIGGLITLERPGGHWQIRAEAARLNIEPGLWSNLASATPVTGITAAQVQFALVPDALRRAERHLSADIGAAAIVLRF